MSIFSKAKAKVKSVVKKVKTAVKKVVSSVSKKTTGTKGASALYGRGLPNAGAKYVATSNAKVARDLNTYNTQTAAAKKPTTKSGGMTSYQGSYAQSVAKGLNYSASPGNTNPKPTTKSGGSSSSRNMTPYIGSYAQMNSPELQNSVNNGLNEMGTNDAPTNANNINPTGGTGTVNIPNSPYNTPDISNAVADTAANKAYNDGMLKDEQANMTPQDQMIQQNQSILDKMFNSQQQQQEVRQDFEKYYKIQAQQAKIQSLTNDFNTLVAQRDEQIAQETSRFGLQDFTNNRIAQIHDNADARINQMSADIKFETAILTQKQEMVQQAVADWSKDMDRTERLYELFMDNHKDLISRLDKKQQDALDKSFELYKMDKNAAIDMRSRIADYAFKYPEAGINWKTDTQSQVQEKLRRAGVNESGSGSKYSVVAGDEPSVIAKKLGLTEDTIVALNPGVNWYNLNIGQKLNTDTSKLKATESLGEISKTDYNKGLNFLYLDTSPADLNEAINLYQTDRGFQASILEQANQ